MLHGWMIGCLFPLHYLARGMLAFLGWTLVPLSEQQYLHSRKRAVCIYPHTTYWDFVFGVLYALAQPELTKHAYAVMKPQPFRWCGGLCGNILRGCGFLPATRREDCGEGFVGATAAALSSKERFQVVLSPEGTRLPNAWRSGYFYLAKTLDAPIMVIGLDYELQQLVMKAFYSVGESREPLESLLKEEMGDIVPLYPSCSPIPVRKYKRRRWINIVTSVTQLLSVGLILLCSIFLSRGFSLVDFPFFSLL